jgi:hypothetical protein
LTSFLSMKFQQIINFVTAMNTSGTSCEIVALRKNFIDRPESYDSFSAKSCVFLAHGLGVYFSIPSHNLAQSKVSKISKTFTYYSRTISNLTKFDFPLPRDQTSRSRIWQMISRLLWMISDIRKVSGGTSAKGKCRRNILIPCFGSDCVWEWRNIPQTVHVFSCARNTQLLALYES